MEFKYYFKYFKSIIIFFIVLISFSIAFSLCTYETKENEYGIVRQFGKVVSITKEPGLNYKTPFIQSVTTIPNTVLIYDLPVSDVITKDKKSMVADSFVLWEITDPLKFIQTLNGQISNAEYRINTTVYNSLKNVISSMNQPDIIKNRDGELADAILENIGDNFSQYGIKLLSIETKRLDLPNDNKAAVYERMISERNNIAASFIAEGESEATKIRNETDKNISMKISSANAEAEKIIAEGEAEYMKVLSTAYSDKSKAEFYEFVRALDAAKASMKGSDKTLFLSSDSPIAKIFYSID